jgi:AcrR family transcriptional regulator
VRTLLSRGSRHPQEAVAATPARQRILDAALGLIRRRESGGVTTREIAMAAGAAEGGLFKNFGDKMGLLTELLSYVLPENQAWRSVAIEAPPQSADPCSGWNYGPIPRPGQLREAGCAPPARDRMIFMDLARRRAPSSGSRAERRGCAPTITGLQLPSVTACSVPGLRRCGSRLAARGCKMITCQAGLVLGNSGGLPRLRADAKRRFSLCRGGRRRCRGMTGRVR